MALAAMAAGISCTDLSEVEGRIDSLETQVSGINSALKTIQDNLKNNVYVSKVESAADGYTIYFTNGTTATIRNGAKGDKGDTGAAGTAGAQGEKGETGAPGKDGDSLFASVEVKDGFVNLTLADGSVIVLPMAPSTVGMINSMTFVSEYNDGKATIECTSPEAATVKLGYLVGPQAAAVALKGKIESKDVTVNVWAAPVQTRSTVENAILLDVVSVAFEGAYMTIVADASDALKLGEVSLLVQFIGEGTDYYSPMVPAVKEERFITYAGETYGFAKMKDGKIWMTENLRYIPEGMTVTPLSASYTPDTSTGIWYPATFGISEANAAVVTPSNDASVIAAQGLLYTSSVALAGEPIPTADMEDCVNKRGICPEGWHIPTAQEWIDLVGACAATKYNNTSAPYYDAALSGADLSVLNADGFNFLPYPYINQGKSYLGSYLNKDSSREFYGYASMAYFHSSTGRSATQNYAAMITNNATKSSVNVSYSHLTNGIAVRCVKD